MGADGGFVLGHGGRQADGGETENYFAMTAVNSVGDSIILRGKPRLRALTGGGDKILQILKA